MYLNPEVQELWRYIGDEYDRLGCHEQTLRMEAASDGDFPDAVCSKNARFAVTYQLRTLELDE